MTAAVPLVQAIVAERGERARRRDVERERAIEAFLVANLIQAVNHAAVPWENTGVQLFVVKGRWRWTRHVRAAKVRIGAVPSSGVHWTKGKGIIGRCWETRTPQFADLAAHFAPYVGCTREQWDRLDADVRYGLTFDDFQRLGAKYGVVAAVPMIDRHGKYIGCVTLDTAPDGDARAINRDELLKSLSLTADLVQAGPLRIQS